MFDRLSVLVVEDNQFMRGILIEILRSLKVGKIVSCPDGGEAIRVLKQVAINQKRVGGHGGAIGFDLVMSDLVMSPIDGLMLLRWVRNSEDSPDRFMPFIMVSGAADRDRVQAARDMGVSEFLAKPFSVKSVADYLIAAIEAPRPFLFTKDYFGPDRRRQQRPFADDDRRAAQEGDLEIVLSSSKLRNLASAGKNKAFMFSLPNRLKEKIAGLGGGPLRIDPALLEQAEKKLDRLETDYSDWVVGTMKQLTDHYFKAVDAEDRRKCIAHVQSINRIAHDLRGQGSTFGYPLVTIFCRSLYDCTYDASDVTDSLLDFIKAHIDGVNVVVRDRVKGDGGQIGKELVKSLEIARSKLTIQ